MDFKSKLTRKRKNKSKNKRKAKVLNLTEQKKSFFKDERDKSEFIKALYNNARSSGDHESARFGREC